MVSAAALAWTTQSLQQQLKPSGVSSIHPDVRPRWYLAPTSQPPRWLVPLVFAGDGTWTQVPTPRVCTPVSPGAGTPDLWAPVLWSMVSTPAAGAQRLVLTHTHGLGDSHPGMLLEMEFRGKAGQAGLVNSLFTRDRTLSAPYPSVSSRLFAPSP